MLQTKHQLVIAHIEALSVGEKVSVRQLARELSVSEGTVYRAIKDAENQGLVSSIPKVGTLRIEKDQERTIDTLTFYELCILLEGWFLAGEKYKDDMPKSYMVAFSVADLTSSKINNNTMIITVGDIDIIKKSVELSMPVLIAENYGRKEIAPEDLNVHGGVVLATPYAVFETISMINQSVFERVKRRSLAMVSDIMSTKAVSLMPHNTIADYHSLAKQTHHSRFPVIDNNYNLVGIVTSHQVNDQKGSVKIGQVMINDPIAANTDDGLSYLARLFVLESANMLPVLSVENTLAGVVTRQDVIEALQSTQKQPQFGDTVDSIVLSGFKLTKRNPEVEITGEITEFMLDETGEASIGNISMIASNAAIIAVRLKENIQCQPCQLNIQIYEPIVEGMLLSARVMLFKTNESLYQSVVYLESEKLILGMVNMLLMPYKR